MKHLFFENLHVIGKGKTSLEEFASPLGRTKRRTSDSNNIFSPFARLLGPLQGIRVSSTKLELHMEGKRLAASSANMKKIYNTHQWGPLIVTRSSSSIHCWQQGVEGSHAPAIP